MITYIETNCYIVPSGAYANNVPLYRVHIVILRNSGRPDDTEYMLRRQFE